jgi:replicative DNA helicase
LATTDYSLAHSLPANVEAERSILGAILLDNLAYHQAAEHLKPEDFSLDSHRRLYSRMMDLAESSRPIDMITLVEELERRKELEAIGDVGYISGLVDGVPDRPSIEHYVKIVRDKALLRGLIHTANAAITRAAEQSDPAEEILNDAEAAIFQLSEKRIGRGFMGVQEIVKESFGSVDALLQRGQRITGLATHYTDLDEMTSGLQKSDLVIIAARPSMGKTAFALNIAENAAIEDQKVIGVFSLEMSREALLLRLLCSRARVDSHKMRTGSLWRDDMSKVVRAMEELASEGKVREIGVSNFSVRETREAQEALSRKVLASNQVEYSLVDRSIEDDLLPYCTKEHVTIIAYSPIARGQIPGGGRENRWRILDEIAREYGKTRTQVALNWLICKDDVVAIPKAGNLDHVKENAGSVGWKLSETDQQALNRAFS